MLCSNAEHPFFVISTVCFDTGTKKDPKKGAGCLEAWALAHRPRSGGAYVDEQLGCDALRCEHPLYLCQLFTTIISAIAINTLDRRIFQTFGNYQKVFRRLPQLFSDVSLRRSDHLVSVLTFGAMHQTVGWLEE